ncbi:MAG: DUF4124 domain-containing protein [Gammaproteobacteria bacterium]|nr:MAG: DUF4124 domain-containing protein [Gammaproteobacteria bacterium]
MFSLTCRFLLSLFLLFFLSVANSGEIYKWVDERGRTHYGDRPTNDNAKKIELEVDQTQNTEVSDKQVNLQEKVLKAYDRKRAWKEQEQRKKEEQKTQRKIECAKIRIKLKEYKDGFRIYTEDDQGNRTYISEEQRAKDEKEMKEALEKNC